MGETAWVDAVPRAVVSDEQVTLEPEYHWYEYGLVPPEAWAVRVADWPESIVWAAGVIAPATNGVFTLTAVASGGFGGYTYAWYQGATCSGSVLGTSASYTTSALTSTTTYCGKVTDSLGGTATAKSTVTVNPTLVAGAITPSSLKIDSGQSITLTGGPSGG